MHYRGVVSSPNGLQRACNNILNLTLRHPMLEYVRLPGVWIKVKPQVEHRHNCEFTLTIGLSNNPPATPSRAGSLSLAYHPHPMSSPSSQPLPFLTPDFPGIGGTIKERDEDFFVQELPLYEPSGTGEHVYCEIQKVGLNTFDALDRLSQKLGVPPVDIGYAGMKDRRAVTRQLFSIRGVTNEAVAAIKDPDLEVLWTSRHGNKIRLGHLAGNRFAIKIRNVDPLAVTSITAPLKLLETRGVPNYFGEQRFGRRNNNDKLGAALIRQDNRELAHLLLGDPIKHVDDGMQYKARRLFDEGDLEGAMKAWPRRNGLERRLLHRVMKTGKASGAGRALDEKLRRLFVSALQSRVFNDVLAQRVTAGTYDTLIEGDWAYKHENGACFHVEDVSAEKARAAAWEVSATGPLIGFRVSLCDMAAGEIEQAILAQHQLTPEMFKVPGYHRVKGARRPLRVKPEDLKFEAGVDEVGGYILLAFTLPAGAFATVLLREIMKTEPEERPESPRGEEGSAPSQDDHAADHLASPAHPLGATESDDDDDGDL
jgi:tRNA pseudouridine13 synthase